MRRHSLAVTVLLCGIFLAGCTAPVQPEYQTCVEFASSVDRFAELAEGATAPPFGNLSKMESEEFHSYASVYETLSQQADGPVEETLSALTALVKAQTTAHIAIEPNEYFEALAAVKAACSSAGVDVEFQS